MRKSSIIVIACMIMMLFSYSIGLGQREIIVQEKIIYDTVFVEDTNSYASFPYKISEAGKNHIKSYEKCSLTAYMIGGQKTIGWGHLIKKGESYSSITQEKADRLFDIDIKIHEVAMNNLLRQFEGKFKFTQGFIDGFCSLVYNCGEEGVRKTEFYKRLQRSRYDSKINNINANDYIYALAAVKNANVTMKGHIKRRQKEYEMMIL